MGGPEARLLDRLDAAGRRDRLLPHLAAEVLEPADRRDKAWRRDEHVVGGVSAR